MAETMENKVAQAWKAFDSEHRACIDSQPELFSSAKHE
jgi:hypothetical protein